MLTTFGYPYTIELATRPEKALGSPEEWEEAIGSSARCWRPGARTIGRRGWGAFYGPEAGFQAYRRHRAEWQGPTVQLDFNLPDRFDIEYIGDDNERHRPVMLHRVLVGSMERFVGGLIEHYAGEFPLWLAPEQVGSFPFRSSGSESGFGSYVHSWRPPGSEPRWRIGRPWATAFGRRRSGRCPTWGSWESGRPRTERWRSGRGETGKKQEILDRTVFLERLLEEIRTRALA
jgi:hypothetical protein